MTSQTVIPVELEELGGGQYWLKGPCDDIYLHQVSVTVFNRLGEDAETLTPMNITNTLGAAPEITQAPDQSNPSRRRHGLKIHFSCEACSYDEQEGKEQEYHHTLCIVQHKGNTIVSWENDTN